MAERKDVDEGVSSRRTVGQGWEAPYAPGFANRCGAFDVLAFEFCVEGEVAGLPIEAGIAAVVGSNDESGGVSKACDAEPEYS